MTHEQKFLQALKDVFIGAPVEGESGYINLMRIKARYFERGIAPRLLADVRAALAPFPTFREELFDKLYSFFHRYFSESGSIYFRYTPLHQNVYARVYTDDRDVMLFWKTHMLYYVKTDRLFQNMEVKVDNFTFYFDVSALQHKQSNEKRALVFDFAEKRANDTLVFTVSYSERGSKTKMVDIQRALRAANAEPREEVLERAFRLFERQSEVDYFINKDARAFLREQFDLWMYQYVFSEEGTWTAIRVQQLQVLRDIAYKLIDFIAQFEDELVKVWNKPKFVRGSHYVITLDRIAAAEQGDAVLRRVLAHPGMAAQLVEWRKLGMVDDAFTPEAVWQRDLFGQRLDDAYQYLPLDTRHFPNLELDILALFDDLDDTLDGWLVHGENYQALRTLTPKIRKAVDFIYIDPPYNADGFEILYVNTYRSSSWITLMENRLLFVPDLLKPDVGVLAIAIDDFELNNLAELLRLKFPSWDLSTIVVNHHPQGTPKANVSRTHEYCLVATAEGADILRVPRPEDRPDERSFMRSGTGENNFRYGRPKSFYAILVDPKTSQIKGVEPYPENEYPLEPTEEGYIRVYPIDGSGNERVWRKTYTSGVKAVKANVVFCRMSKDKPVLYERVDISRVKPTSNWYDTRYNAGTHGSSLLSDLFPGPAVFSYPKSIFTVRDTIDAGIYENDEALVFDFFAGSGTTAHAIMNLNREDGGRRKYILVEMDEHFENVILPRVKKAAFSDKWKDGQAQPGGQGLSHFVKVYSLEQYEDALRLARYEDADLFQNPYADPYSSYVFLRDLKMLEAVDLDTETESVSVHLDRLYPDIDLAETLSCVTGKPIKRITAEEVEFRDGTRADLVNPEWELVKPLIWW